MTYIIDAVRTPIGRFMKTFTNTTAVELGTHCVKGLLLRTGVNPDGIQDVIIGQVLVTGQGMNPARQTAWHGGIPYTTPAMTINHVCGSGLRSVMLGTQSIQTGLNCVLVGGQENMTLSQFGGYYDRKNPEKDTRILKDTMLQDSLMCAIKGCHMGNTAENLAKKYNISRAEQDDFALASHQKAQYATEQGYFKDEILPINGINADQHIRFDMQLQDLHALNPAFDKKNGTVTAGNASGVNDGASMVVLGSVDFVRQHTLTPMAKIVSYGMSGVAPEIMGIGPVKAVQNALKSAGWGLQHLDLMEANEAFAVQAIAVNKQLEWDTRKVNISGGAVALGHPVGASGTRILTTLIHNLKRTGGKRGVATLCIGGGQGIAMCVEMV